jgi:hypothetical protein
MAKVLVLLVAVALRAPSAEDRIRIGWTIPEEAKYGIMRRPDLRQPRQDL